MPLSFASGQLWVWILLQLLCIHHTVQVGRFQKNNLNAIYLSLHISFTTTRTSAHTVLAMHEHTNLSCTTVQITGWIVRSEQQIRGNQIV